MKGRDFVQSAFQSYDPLKSIQGRKDNKAIELQKHVHGHIYPKQLGGGSVLGRFATQHGGGKSVTQKQSKFIVPAKNFVEDFKEMHGRRPSVDEISQGINLSKKQTTDLMKNIANEYNTQSTENDEDLELGLALKKRDRIWAVYGAADEKDKAIMEARFHGVLGKPAPTLKAGMGLGGELSRQLGVSQSDISTRTKNIINRIIRR